MCTPARAGDTSAAAWRRAAFFIVGDDQRDTSEWKVEIKRCAVVIQKGFGCVVMVLMIGMGTWRGALGACGEC